MALLMCCFCRFPVQWQAPSEWFHAADSEVYQDEQIVSAQFNCHATAARRTDADYQEEHSVCSWKRICFPVISCEQFYSQ